MNEINIGQDADGAGTDGRLMKTAADGRGAVWPKLELGVCYYPEHWDESYWAEDLRRMKNAGLGTIRIAEFAWNKFEPEEGIFTFEFFDRFMEYASRAEMKVIFCTPTATPPAWLTSRYPECLNAKLDGTLYRHGARRHYNYNSPKYREFCARIVQKLGEHYGAHPNIVGWQIDNELNCGTSDFYSESDHLAFREFLKEKYGSIQALNSAWGAEFWNMTYTDWDEVYGPQPTVSGAPNPHQKLDYSRFVSASARSFCRMQSEILSRFKKPGDFITTNGLFGRLDNVRMTEESLDTYTYDSYPNFAYDMRANPVHSRDLNDRRYSRNLSEARAVCPHFGIMEQQSGCNGEYDTAGASSPKPGQMMLWSMQSIAHGADYVSFFRWRTCRFGREIYWRGILDWDSRAGRCLDEVRRIADRVRKMEDMAGAGYAAAFALVKSYDNQWDAEGGADFLHGSVQGFSESEIFCGAQLSHTPMDIVYLGEASTPRLLTPERYPLLIYPHGMIVSEEDKEVLEAYVREGGILCIGCRTGYKDPHGRCVTMPTPGLLRELAGGTVTDFTWVRPEEKVQVLWQGRRFEMPLFNDVLDAETAKVSACYEGNYYDGQPAILENQFGKGRVLYVGGVFTRELTKAVLEWAGVLSPFAYLADVPEECELAVRRKGGSSFLFVLNYMAEARTITLHREMRDIDTGMSVRGEAELPPFGTKVYRLDD